MSDERTGAQIICEALVREGVDVIFGIPGGAIMPFYHALPEYKDRLHHVLCRHEQGAGHAAEGYARASGRVGVCVATSGPGATNLVTPIADAWMDSTPIVAITGQVASSVLGKDAFQETDIIGIALPITKYATVVMDPDEVPLAVAEAFDRSDCPKLRRLVGKRLRHLAILLFLAAGQRKDESIDVAHVFSP